MTAPNRDLVKAVFETVIGDGEDLTTEQRQDLCRALNAVVAHWRARPRVSTGPDVRGFWIDVSHATTTEVQ